MVGEVHEYEILFGRATKSAMNEGLVAGALKVVVQTTVWPWISGEARMTFLYLAWLSVMLLMVTRPSGSQLMTGAQLPLYLTSQSTEM